MSSGVVIDGTWLSSAIDPLGRAARRHLSTYKLGDFAPLRASRNLGDAPFKVKREAGGAGWKSGLVLLDLGDVGGLKTLGSLHHLEVDLLALGERLESVALDGGEVNENVLATLLLDEPEPLRIVEPLHASLCHRPAPSRDRRQIPAVLKPLRPVERP